MTTQPFAAQLLRLLSGVGAASDFLGLVLREAVESLLLQISRDHGLEYRALVDKYRDAVVDAHSRLGDAPGAQCVAIVKRSGKRCARRAVLDGRCASHAAAHATKVSRERRLAAYKETAASAAAAAAPRSAPPRVVLSAGAEDSELML